MKYSPKVKNQRRCEMEIRRPTEKKAIKNLLSLQSVGVTRFLDLQDPELPEETSWLGSKHNTFKKNQKVLKVSIPSTESHQWSSIPREDRNLDLQTFTEEDFLDCDLF
jgi:hypothetical protein